MTELLHIPPDEILERLTPEELDAACERIDQHNKEMEEAKRR